jgi:NAD(P)H dehydrogenase (quinone)
MATNVLVPFYSSYGHVLEMARAVEEGAAGVDDTEVRLRRIPEIEAAEEAMSEQEPYVEAQKEMEDMDRVTIDDMRWADGIVWGIPTRFGNMAAQVKQFIDQLGGLWQNGELADKATGVFVSTNTTHGGQETTTITSLIPLLHLGMVFVGTPYSQNPEIMTGDGIGGSPYGPATIAGPTGERTPVAEELEPARRLGARVTKVARQLQPLREEE